MRGLVILVSPGGGVKSGLSAGARAGWGRWGWGSEGKVGVEEVRQQISNVSMLDRVDRSKASQYTYDLNPKPIYDLNPKP